MKKMKWLFASLLLLAGSGLALAQDAKPVEHRTIAQVLDRGVTGVESEFVSAADAMPEDKYSFAPTSGEFKGVRTFAQQVKHVAAVNYLVSASILEEKPPVDVGSENGPDSVKTKADIVKFLKDSFTYANQESFWGRHDDTVGDGQFDCGALFRPLWSDGGILADEQRRPACQSLIDDEHRQGPGQPGPFPLAASANSLWHESAIYMSKNETYPQLPPFVAKNCDAK
jgi:hypothetical protein